MTKDVSHLMTEDHQVVIDSAMTEGHLLMIDLTDGHLLMIVYVMIEDHMVEVGETGKEIEIGTGIPEIDLPLGNFVI